MRFFKHQSQARWRTTWLVMLYAIAVTLTIGASAWLPVRMFFGVNAPVRYYVYAALAMLALCAGMVIWRMGKLAEGGYVVAQALGGERLIPAQATLNERRLVNIVEEMAIASGVPVPKIYILPDASINAFAAGMSRRDTVIGITRGALQTFNRNELQAVVAHEFSHILNGDVRLNMRLSGWLYGLQGISSIGFFLLDLNQLKFSDLLDMSAYNERILSNSSRADYFTKKNLENWLALGLLSLPLILVSFLLLCIGYLGSLFASWIQAAVSRQREYLADASAVQFARDTEGLTGALHKISMEPVYGLASYHAAEFAHFMFGSVKKAQLFERLSATHPTLLERIERVSPSKARIYGPRMKRALAKKSRIAAKNGAAWLNSAVGAEQDKWTILAEEYEGEVTQTRRQPVYDCLLKIIQDYPAQETIIWQKLPSVWEEAVYGEGQTERLMLAWCCLNREQDVRLPEAESETNIADLIAEPPQVDAALLWITLVLKAASLQVDTRVELLNKVAASTADSDILYYAYLCAEAFLRLPVPTYGQESCLTHAEQVHDVLSFVYMQSNAVERDFNQAVLLNGLPQAAATELALTSFQVALKGLDVLSIFDRENIFFACRQLVGASPSLAQAMLLNYIGAMLLLDEKRIF